MTLYVRWADLLTNWDLTLFTCKRRKFVMQQVLRWTSRRFMRGRRRCKSLYRIQLGDGKPFFLNSVPFDCCTAFPSFSLAEPVNAHAPLVRVRNNNIGIHHGDPRTVTSHDDSRTSTTNHKTQIAVRGGEGVFRVIFNPNTV